MRYGLKIILGVALLQFSFAAYPRETNKEVLDKVWGMGKKFSCTKNMQKAFNVDAYQSILNKTKDGQDRYHFADVLNEFLFSLNLSHTEFFTDKSEGYHFFKSHVALTDPDAPPPPLMANPGVQLEKNSGTYIVREVFDGFSAQVAGVLRGDRILKLRGHDFVGNWQRAEKDVPVEILRNGKELSLSIDIEALNLSEALQKASVNSRKIIRIEKKQIGYVHLWTGTHPDSSEFLQETVDFFNDKKVDGVVLDLRGGYGGAWWAHLKPFFKDSMSFYIAESIDRDGKVTKMEPPIEGNPKYFKGPMAVLINSGTRSGKEALAFQFKKTGRARVFGEQTKGYVTMGRFFYTSEPLDYLLYLCNAKIKIDGVDLEGDGVEPDEHIPFEAKGNLLDSQLSEAVNWLVQPGA